MKSIIIIFILLIIIDIVVSQNGNCTLQKPIFMNFFDGNSSALFTIFPLGAKANPFVNHQIIEGVSAAFNWTALVERENNEGVCNYDQESGPYYNSTLYDKILGSINFEELDCYSELIVDEPKKGIQRYTIKFFIFRPNSDFFIITTYEVVNGTFDIIPFYNNNTLNNNISIVYDYKYAKKKYQKNNHFKRPNSLKVSLSLGNYPWKGYPGYSYLTLGLNYSST